MGTGQTLDQLSDFNNLLRVEPHRRFVQDQDWGVVEHRLCQSDTLAVAARQVADEAMTDRTQLQFSDRLIQRRGQVASGHPAELTDEGEIFRDRKLLIQRGSFWQVADPAFDLERPIGAVESGHTSGSLGWRHEAGQDSHRGGFSCSVRAEESQHLAFRDREGYSVDGRMMSVPLGNVVDVDHGL